MRLIDAMKAFWTVLTGRKLIPLADLDALKLKISELEQELASARKQPKRDLFREGAIYTLVLLQREGRMIDFLQEPIDAYSDDQIGAAVRSIHSGAAKVLKEHFGLKPVRTEPENSAVEISAGFDPQEVKLTGNVPAQAPYKGVLAHKGWRTGTITFPERSNSVNPEIVQPAEVSF